LRRRHRNPTFPDLERLPAPDGVAQGLAMRQGQRNKIVSDLRADEAALVTANAFLGRAPRVHQALDELSQRIFEQVSRALEENLTLWLQEVLEQPLEVKVVTDYKRNSASVEFTILRAGQEEDIMRGQGGSVVNVLSVGLRIFALKLMTDDERSLHRRFLILDEPDAWLRPDRVARLVKIIHEAGRELGFQTILISHHDVELFEEYADKVYRFEPQKDGTVKVIGPAGAVIDDDAEIPAQAIVQELAPDLGLLFD
jgi:DNA repair exonuclease SbcCD ATPase subunit